MTREEALNFLNEKIANKNIVRHMLAAEVLMRALALKLKTHPPAGGSNVKTGEEINEDEWAIAGLLHDGDYCPEVSAERQGVQISQWLKENGYEIPENVVYTMAAHNHATGVKPQSLMDWALFCADPLTGLIVTTALVMPDKKLASVKPESIIKKLADPSFARGTRREDLKMCEKKLAISLQEFVKIGLESMQKISQELGL
ncbi:phosphohydrolase [Candidatus Gottesmanbacteria bacterium]|nr:phosphohydrolase [Candidatus Gottesmanbacteria bacterium]